MVFAHQARAAIPQLGAPRHTLVKLVKKLIFPGFHAELVWELEIFLFGTGAVIPCPCHVTVHISKLYIMVCSPRDRITVQPVPGSSYGRGSHRSGETELSKRLGQVRCASRSFGSVLSMEERNLDLTDVM